MQNEITSPLFVPKKQTSVKPRESPRSKHDVEQHVMWSVSSPPSLPAAADGEWKAEAAKTGIARLRQNVKSVVDDLGKTDKKCCSGVHA
jgi:hypothetical protein